MSTTRSQERVIITILTACERTGRITDFAGFLSPDQQAAGQIHFRTQANDSMDKYRHSRREFIKRQSLAGAGAMLALNTPGILLGKHLSPHGQGEHYNGGGEPIQYFDALTRIGPRVHKHPGELWSMDHLTSELDYCSISGAMVTHTQSLWYDPMHANLALSRQLEEHSHLFPVWNIMPHYGGEFPEPGVLVRLMREHDVRAVTLYPNSNRWDWKHEANRELINVLADNRILTFVTADELGGWDALGEFLTRFPSLPILLNNAGWSDQRYVIPLLKQHRNLHITFERLQINKGIEYYHQQGLIDQIVFGTNAPIMSAGAHRTYVDYADVPREVRQKVAGGNLTRLLRGLRPPSARENRQEDELMTAARRGEPLPTPMLDMHMHILDEGLHGGGFHYRMQDGGPQGVFDMIKRFGNSGGGIMSWNGVVSVDAEAGFQTVSNALDVAPQGYWGLATFDPIHFTKEQMNQRIREVYQDRRLIGMKPYHFYGVQYHDPVYDGWWEYGNERNFYALIHRSREDGAEVETLAEKYPNVRWVIAHAGGTYQWADVAIAAMQKYPNVYAELTFTNVPAGVINYLVDHVGDDRIVYGSDLPMRDPRQQFGWVLFSQLPVESKRKILAANAYDVIRPCLNRLPEHNRPRI